MVGEDLPDTGRIRDMPLQRHTGIKNRPIIRQVCFLFEKAWGNAEVTAPRRSVPPTGRGGASLGVQAPARRAYRPCRRGSVGGLTCPCTALAQRKLQRVPCAVEDDLAGVALTTSHDLRAWGVSTGRDRQRIVCPKLRRRQRRGVAQRLGASAAHGYIRVRMAGLCYDTRPT